MVSESDIQVSTIRRESLNGPTVRLDAKHYHEEFLMALLRVRGCGLPIRLVEDLAAPSVPARAKLVTVPNSSAGAGYLKAHAAFLLRPESDRYMARAAMPDYDDYLLKRGMILTPSSGRNLGPLAYVGRKLAQFAMTDIMRISPNSDAVGLFLYAYLLTPTGQALIRRGRTGTTVDHLSPSDVREIPVVWFDANDRARVVSQMKSAQRGLDQGRLELDEAEKELHDALGLPYELPVGEYLGQPGARSFPLDRRRLSLRVDAAYYDPRVGACKAAVSAQGGQPLSQAADLLMLGRYKRYYVKPDYGRPIMSGRQTLQIRPVNLQYISDRSFKDPSSFILKRGWSVFTCDGRSEEALGAPSFIFAGRSGWMASNHVMRAMPRSGISPGFLYLALRSPYVQLQLKAAATGSVVDALDPTTAGAVVIPRLKARQEELLGTAVADAWTRIDRAIRAEARVADAIESDIQSRYLG